MSAPAAIVDPIDELFSTPRARAHVADRLAHSNAIAAKQATRQARRTARDRRKRIHAALRAWMTSTGLPADEFLVSRLAAGATQMELYREFLCFAPELGPVHDYTFKLYAFRQLHGAPGTPARLRVEAAARARGDRYFRHSRSATSPHVLAASEAVPHV